MFHILLQVWGGLFYLLNKIFFSRAERSDGEKKRLWKISSWVVYLIGLPAWVIIFIFERNWIAAALESGGAPSMALGLFIALRGKGKTPKWLDWVALIAIAVGLGYSLHDFGGITTWNQVLELSMVTGFLVGTYRLAKEKPSGYLWFLLMNASNAVLMAVEGYPYLFIQQVISFGFVADAYLVQRKKVRATT